MLSLAKVHDLRVTVKGRGESYPRGDTQVGEGKHWGLEPQGENNWRLVASCSVCVNGIGYR